MTADAMTFQTKEHPWWLTLMGGILNIVIGLLLITVPAKTVVALVVALGIYWLIAGVFTLIGMFVDHAGWGWKLFLGLIQIIAGFLILRYPLAAAIEIPQVILFMVALGGIVVGAIFLVAAFQGGGLSAGILGVISLLFGGILLVNYWRLAAIVGLVWFAAILAFVGGIAQIYQAFQQRSA